MSVSNRRFIATSIIFTAILSIGIAISGCGFDRVVKAQSKPDRLQTVLSQMDAASAKFRSAEADVKKEQFTKIVNDTTTETGKIYFLRTGSTTQSGAKLNPPDARTFEYKNGLLRLFTPGTNHIDQYSAGAANQSRYEAFLSLGFGGSGSDLAKAWTITDQGTEQITDSGKPVSVEKLDLVSKEASVRNNYTHITIWVDPVRDVSLKQVFFDVSGDTNSAIYSNIRLNQSIDLKTYAIKCQGKCS
ncbi:MAG TPA: outer membrane lipoprotein-sorting protein [Acidobacteriaceae bacterium]